MVNNDYNALKDAVEREACITYDKGKAHATWCGISASVKPCGDVNYDVDNAKQALTLKLSQVYDSIEILLPSADCGL